MAQHDGAGQDGKSSSVCSSAEHSVPGRRPVHKPPSRGTANRRPGHKTATEGPVCDPARIAAAPAPRTGKCEILAAQNQPRNEPSAAYRESIRRTVEKRRQRRARRGQQPGTAPVGAIVPWPMSPALIIRQTPAVHGEVSAYLGGLRR